MHIGMSEAKEERMNFRARPDVKQDALILAERFRVDLTEVMTRLLVTEIEKEKEMRPELWKDAARRVAERQQAKRKGKKPGRKSQFPRKPDVPHQDHAGPRR